MDARKARTFSGTVTRVDPPEDGWGEGILVLYPKVKFKGQPALVFHEWPSLWAKEA
jgi:hypothetical protein